jgi:prepilin-type N-terminal cleavage/methylation domain-containing protein
MMIGKYHNSNSFTLIELIIVLVIVAVIGMVSVPRVTTGIETMRYRETVTEFITFLRNAHLEAILSRKDINVAVDLERNILERDNGEELHLPHEIILSAKDPDIHGRAKYLFFYNGRGSGPEIFLIGNNERKALIYIDSLSGLARYDLN